MVCGLHRKYPPSLVNWGYASGRHGHNEGLSLHRFKLSTDFSEATDQSATNELCLALEIQHPHPPPSYIGTPDLGEDFAHMDSADMTTLSADNSDGEWSDTYALCTLVGAVELVYLFYVYTTYLTFPFLFPTYAYRISTYSSYKRRHIRVRYYL